jgi:hypothetical protein
VAHAEASAAGLVRGFRPGGALRFVGDARAAAARAARRQRRWARPWAAVAGGCSCTRDTLGLLARHFLLDEVAHHRWRGMPAIVQPLVAGRAVARPEPAS